VACAIALGICLLLAQEAVAASADPHAVAAPNPARALVERAALDMRTNPEASRQDAEAALLELRSHPDADLEIRARLLLCDYQAERSATAAQVQIDLASRLLPHAQRQGLRAGVMTCSGEVRETAGNNVEARALFDRAVAIATATHDQEMLAEALFSRGYLLGLQAEYANGLADLRRAQSLFDQLAKPLHALTALDSIAILYNRMGDYVQARHIYSEALKAQRAARLLSDEAVTLYNLGRVDENLHDWKEARQSFTEALELCQRIGYSRGAAYALRGLGAVANAYGDPQGALLKLQAAQTLQQQTSDARLGAQIALERGIALHGLKRMAESLTSLTAALQVFKAAEALSELDATYAELAAVHAELANWRAAYEFETDHAQIAYRLLTSQIDQRFATLKVEFDTAAQEKENAALLRENEASRKALAQARSVRRLQATVIALTVLLAAALATFALHQRSRTVRMRALAMTDELTGVPNRRAVLGRLGALLESAQTGCCAVLILDIDHFKSINDQLGHAIGDEVLKAVADEVRIALHEPAFLGRLGGEEFLIALPEIELLEALQIAERFRERIMRLDTARWFKDRRIITASIGATVSILGADTPSSMLKRADGALYNAKRSGRNCVRTDPTLVDIDPTADFWNAQPQEAPSVSPGTRIPATDLSEPPDEARSA